MSFSICSGSWPELEAVDDLVEFRPHILAGLLAHLAHHAAQRLGIIFQAGQVGRIGHAFQAAFFGFGDAHLVDAALDVAALAVRADSRLAAVLGDR